MKQNTSKVDSLLELCREVLKDSSNSAFSVSDWEELYDLVTRNGVTAFTYDSTKNLPIPRKTAISWALSAENITARYHKQYSAAQRLSQFYSQNGIRMMILKGIGLSLYYPNPQTRECGDIDIYLFDDYERGNEIVNTPIHYHDKHAVFVFEGVTIENHYEFVTTERQKHNIEADKTLRYLIDKYGTIEKDGFLLPSPQFNLLFTLRHTANHIDGGIPLRQIIDWALLFRAEHDKIDEELREIILKNGLARLFDAMTLLAMRLMDEDFTNMLFNPSRADKYAEILLSMVENKKWHTIQHTIFAKLNYSLSLYPRYRLVPDSFLGMLRRRTKEYFINRRR